MTAGARGWARAAAARFQRPLPAPVPFEEYLRVAPLDLADMIDRAHGRPVRTAGQRYAEYVANCASVAAQRELDELVAAANARNAEIEAELAAAVAGAASAGEAVPEPRS